VQVIILPPNAQQRTNQMMVMETAISAAMSHPNIIQTFTYAVRHAGAAGTTSVPPSPYVTSLPTYDRFSSDHGEMYT
jgi:hypothetical protein